MTKAVMNIDERGSVYFDCLEHAGDNEVCVAVSTLCNVLVTACIRSKWPPAVYEEGHVTIDIPNAALCLREQFLTVWEVFKELAEQHPEHVKLY